MVDVEGDDGFHVDQISPASLGYKCQYSPLMLDGYSQSHSQTRIEGKPGHLALVCFLPPSPYHRLHLFGHAWDPPTMEQRLMAQPLINTKFIQGPEV